MATSIYDSMAAFFKKDDWPATQLEGQTAMSMNFQGQNGRWGCLARVDQEKELILFYSYCPVKAPEDKRPILADFLTRANYGLYIGNFEMDFNDGEVRYKTSIDVEGNIGTDPADKPTDGAAADGAAAPEKKEASTATGEQVQLTFPLMKRLVYNNVGVMDKYMPGIMAVVYGGASPTEAIAKVES
ncbi:MAG: YbjN domain-containing protein [Chloroflexia bacterium]